jgi:hypothetical protein
MGEPGQQGEQGPPGKQGGAAGSAAVAVYRPTFWVGCVSTMDLISASGSGVQRVADGMDESILEYTVTIYSDHDVQVTCEAAIGSAQAGSSGQYYPSTTKGSSTGHCSASADYSPPVGTTAGFWRFEIDADGPVATYDDPDDPLGLDGFMYRFTQNDCNTYSLGEDGTWNQVTLSDVF